MELYVTKVESKPFKYRGFLLEELPVGYFARPQSDPDCIVLKHTPNSCVIVVGGKNKLFDGDRLNGWTSGAGSLRFIPLKKGEAIAVGGE